MTSPMILDFGYIFVLLVVVICGYSLLDKTLGRLIPILEDIRNAVVTYVRLLEGSDRRRQKGEPSVPPGGKVDP